MASINKTGAYKHLDVPSARAVQEGNLYADAALARAIDGATPKQLQITGYVDPSTTDGDVAYLSRVLS